MTCMLGVFDVLYWIAWHCFWAKIDTFISLRLNYKGQRRENREIKESCSHVDRHICLSKDTRNVQFWDKKALDFLLQLKIL